MNASVVRQRSRRMQQQQQSFHPIATPAGHRDDDYRRVLNFLWHSLLFLSERTNMVGTCFVPSSGEVLHYTQVISKAE